MDMMAKYGYDDAGVRKIPHSMSITNDNQNPIYPNSDS
jgi:hypothetical protein